MQMSYSINLKSLGESDSHGLKTKNNFCVKQSKSVGYLLEAENNPEILII